MQIQGVKAMTLLIKAISIAQVQSNKGCAHLECMCCKHSETASKPMRDITRNEWLLAAHQVGWRHIQSENFEIEVVCPKCVDAFNQCQFKKPKKVAV